MFYGRLTFRTRCAYERLTIKDRVNERACVHVDVHNSACMRALLPRYANGVSTAWFESASV
jgi:hypothetical protein